jgi:hypothetical protein
MFAGDVEHEIHMLLLKLQLLRRIQLIPGRQAPASIKDDDILVVCRDGSMV